ncbi:alpha/beta hydrolase [Lentibacter sp. XHP0401]|uniref:alpha/beta hydrolase n=1 Tax=Lentibacter sp. XHP0401 TaxID=2984334 RepID=UPI0021E8374B|nr:alpha/beta fold hydrolase [Lentibacter sp. XHP0401]MCV2894662.1 alpha/beta fold hydrolase [Lentibacter sp. XHP0401]
MTNILEGAEPFEFAGNDIGVLLIHGFTGTTQSMRYVGEQLNKRFGFTTVGARLPGHGTTVQDMAASNEEDWIEEADRALKDLAARRSKVFVAGLSMGGTLTLSLAARYPNMVQAIAPINAAAHILNDQIAEVLFMTSKPEYLPGVGSDIKDPNAKELAYTEIPSASLSHLMTLVMGTDTKLKSISCPIQVIQSREDHVVPAANARHILANVSSDDVRLRWLNESYHVATLDNDKDIIVDTLGRFFQEIADG